MKHFPWACAAVAGLALVVGWTSAAPAAIVAEIESVNIQSSPTGVVDGYFDVYLGVTGTPANVGAYQIEVELPGDNSALNKIFLSNAQQAGQPVHPGHSPLFPGQTPTTLATNQILQFGDFLPGINAQNPVFDGVGIATVHFTIQPNVSGVFPITFDTSFSDTHLTDGMGNDFAFDSFVNGTLTVTAVPEPSALILAAGLGGMLALVWRRRSLSVR